MATLEDLGRRVSLHRGSLALGIRAAAKEIGISHATLSRIERGHLPDLENYQRICRWLGDDPEVSVVSQPADSVSGSAIAEVHFRKRSTVTIETAQALAQMILAAQVYLAERESEF
jgi:transcriptional regulator with XRE-family HTH domain